MPRIFRTLLFLSLILSACSSGGIIPEAPPPTTVTDVPEITEVSPPPKIIVTVSTPHVDQGPDGASTVVSNPQECAYQWAYKDLPELSADFQRSIQELQPEAQAMAYGFGEDCIHADGTSDFLPKETDFNITLQVSDLSNESDLGAWIVKVMQIIDAIPSDQIIGPQPGRVSMVFQSNADQKTVSFYTDRYHALDSGMSGAEIYQALQTP